MGWATCGQDDLGRLIGYAYPATCDQPGCHEQIDRGLSYACGDMHGGGDHGCGRYFCGKHLHAGLSLVDDEVEDPTTGDWVRHDAWVCRSCAEGCPPLCQPEIDNGNVITVIEGISLKVSARGLPWAHARRCLCTVDQTFTCNRCGRRFGWCLGVTDDLPGACDFCWADANGGTR